MQPRDADDFVQACVRNGGSNTLRRKRYVGWVVGWLRSRETAEGSKRAKHDHQRASELLKGLFDVNRGIALG
ncbi:hypothetical protein M0802_009389 [Mischocyttarus mexicanus]|nr:hypothetical protein M0802_009389 [Mischocyttarus mexicanus]